MVVGLLQMADLERGGARLHHLVRRQKTRAVRIPKGKRSAWGLLVAAMTPKAGSRVRDAFAEGLQAVHRGKTSRPRNPNQHRADKPLQCVRHRQERSRGLKPVGKGEVTPQA
ncbi:hypothetical protein EOK75_16030 (plasmid) [Pseudorhodobacter turbinis]|uniref:Uncharacterized protein n=2 Tax=Pseudorhodobacter turbinis TaxID=2500533 RepID=A0A4P8EK63_9RHOB|nr:hypothetical protein EOK75_16030 [Pseudorhodobacter turbinis]